MAPTDDGGLFGWCLAMAFAIGAATLVISIVNVAWWVNFNLPIVRDINKRAAAWRKEHPHA